MALITYIRVSDNLKLVRDKNLEVTDLLYIPVADSFGDLGIGDGDPAKSGAVAAYMDGDDVKLAIYQGDGTWEPVGADPTTPTLQEVTDEGSTTTNTITALGFNANNYVDVSGRIRVRTDEAGITFQDDIQNYSHLNLHSNIVRLGGHISVLSAGTSGTPTYGSLSTDILTSSRIFTLPDKSGTIALLDDILTAPTFTEDNSVPNTGALSYLNSNYPSAQPGDQVYKIAAGIRRTWTCYAEEEWSRIDEVIEE